MSRKFPKSFGQVPRTKLSGRQLAVIREDADLARRKVASTIAGSGGASDPNFSSVSLLLPLNGADAATTTTDESSLAHTVTFVGAGTELDTAQAKFGTASLLMPTGLGKYIQCASHTSFAVGAGDFTMENHARLGNVSGTHSWFNRLISSGQYEYQLRYDGTDLIFAYSVDSTTIVNLTVAWSPAANTWYHLAVCRDGNNLRFFVDGTQVGATQDVTGVTINSGTDPLRIGDGFLSTFSDHVDNVRFTKGVARYTADFAAPTAEYPTS